MFFNKMKIQTRYFAKLREERGCSAETVETQAQSVREFYLELQAKHQFSLAPENLKVAINEEFTGWDTHLQENDMVVFIQPVAGG
jgi:molybdopterin converting factor small subunit